jgi:hypothetical protein
LVLTGVYYLLFMKTIILNYILLELIKILNRNADNLIMKFLFLIALFSCSQVNDINLRSMSTPDSKKPANGEGTGTPPETSELTTRFTNTLLPLIDEQCSSCHALPAEATSATPAPLTIKDPVKVTGWVQEGSSVSDNKFINKINGKVTHTGPSPCTSASNTLCQEFLRWSASVRGEDETIANSGLLSSVTWNGYITGYAYIESSPDQTVDVEVVVNDTTTISITADQPGFVNDVQGDHRFYSQLDAASYEHGMVTKINAYALINGTRTELANSPMEVTLYKPSAETYFNTNVAPNLATCANNGCHFGDGVWTYDLAIERLADKTPDTGGTATNNTFFNRASGLGGHAGGNQCANVAGLCDAISSWWTEEFE